MIQLKIDIEHMQSGRVSVELQTGVSKTKPITKVENQVACHLRATIAVIISELASKIPGSSLAIGREDVETMRGLEDLDIKEETGGS